MENKIEKLLFILLTLIFIGLICMCPIVDNYKSECDIIAYGKYMEEE